MKLIGAGYLLYLAIHHFLQHGGEEARRTPPKATAMLGLSAFWATVVKVELTDIVFAIDSILVAVAMSPKMWVILTGGILGIVAMRLVIGQLLAIVERYPALVDGAFIIIAWVGIKLLIEYLHAAGYIALRDAEVAVARPDRGDLRDRVLLRPRPRGARHSPNACRRGRARAADRRRSAVTGALTATISLLSFARALFLHGSTSHVDSRLMGRARRPAVRSRAVFRSASRSSATT